MIFNRNVIPGTQSRLKIVDHMETYGRYILEKVVQDISVHTCLDLGCGGGGDLDVVQTYHPEAQCFGVDFGDWNREVLVSKGIEPLVVNIENQPLPFEDESVDFVIANQILEHTKEIYWINHELFRVLSVGGHLYLGVPNLLSLHNRLLGLFGVHPTSLKLISAHVRGFSKRDTYLFYRQIAASFMNIRHFYGAQFYPFPKWIARGLSTLFPALSVSHFYVIQKTGPYQGEFVDWVSTHQLETNFYLG